ncbi:MAG: Gfo/Idh/MocA family oxidoreductase [Chloroflexi bacterium]|nr:Gfo/Idh/MocA family oxidoreductase [Ardenticatenaceae bacterium]MBL1128078.1 gfo/Idh/MocA family oxidoreductase [Chloroflexota bacterium]NOG34149.1 Gfo/Idh/MocA family oxidoreductase [Chloroflexota bacterium]
MIGVGGMARHHLRAILANFPSTHVSVVCEPSAEAYAETVKLFTEHGRTPPSNQPDLTKLLAEYGDELDAAFIITPHAYHHDQAQACLEAGLDVLLEKPMVMNVAEAQSLIRTRDETGRLLVVAFNGSLSPEIRAAAALLRSGELGKIQSISATVWQNWQPNTAGTWRQNPALSGGGFLFDTGAHMLNTVADLAGEDFVEVAAWLDNNGAPVDILGVVMGRLVSGALVTLHASGATVPSCASDVRVFCEQAILNTGVWGQWLHILKPGSKEFEPVVVPETTGAWEQFLAVRDGHLPNPCPPEVGLRMARLWDAIQASAARGGQPVKCN